jgi:aspartate 1-decarboxylase
MLRQFLFAKIHRAVVTAKDVNYNGSITVDSDILSQVGIQVWERVQVVDVNNGARFETYVIAGEAGSGAIQLNGAAAHLVELGDRVIIMAYALLDTAEMADHHPVIAILDERNHIVEKRIE